MTIMIVLNRKLLVGLLVLAAVALVFAAAVAGGIEWAFASLGAMVLIGMTGISVYVLAKVLRYASRSKKLVKAGPVSKVDKKLIMKHVDELFVKGLEQSREKPAVAVPISERDKRLIMEHVDKLFARGLGQSEGRPS